MEPDDPKRAASKDDSLQPNPSADEFFSKMNRDFRRPKPSEEAVAAALQAIQALTGDAALEEAAEAMSPPAAVTPETESQCPKCSGRNAESNRFCGFCGATLEATLPGPKRSASVTAEQHVHHHHYHHHYFPSTPIAPEGTAAPDSSATLSAGETPESKEALAVLRKFVQAWALAFNAKRLDDLCALYSEDALLVRPSAALVRGRAEIRKVLQSELESGLGDVHLDCSETGVLGDVACLAGVSRMLAPIAPGNRQERKGKFLMLVRRAGDDWTLLADVWCVDSVQPPQSVARQRK